MKRKSRKEVDRELLTTGYYTPDFSVGDKIISNKVKNLNTTKSPTIYEVTRVIHPITGGEPSYRLYDTKNKKPLSKMCGDMDVKYRKLPSMEAAVFLD